MNGNTHFNFWCYDWKSSACLAAAVAAADSETQSLRESLVVRAADTSWIVKKGIFTPHTSYLGTKNYPFFLQNRGHAEVLKKTTFREIRNMGAAPLYTWVPPPPPPDPLHNAHPISLQRKHPCIHNKISYPASTVVQFYFFYFCYLQWSIHNGDACSPVRLKLLMFPAHFLNLMIPCS